MVTMNWMVQAAFAVLIVTLAGCLGPRAESLQARTYQLALDAWPTEARLSDGNGPILLVSPLQAEPGFETTRMVYLKRPYELEHYAVNQWADTPARMFASLLVQALGRHRTWRTVVPLPGSVRGDYRLDTHGFALQQEFLQVPSRVRMTIRTQLVDLKDSKMVGARAFEAVENAPSDDAYGGVLAANRASAVLLDQIAAWLQECVRHSPACNR
jgi:cholesterol transport system auxiliary component